MVVENQYPTRVEAPSLFGCGYAARCTVVTKSVLDEFLLLKYSFELFHGAEWQGDPTLRRVLFAELSQRR
jgi:hypothetical protein